MCTRSVSWWSTWLVATCAIAPGCRHTVEDGRGPALQIVGESMRHRMSDPLPTASPWFDGTRVSVTAARGEVIGLQVLHHGGGPVTIRLPAQVVVTGFAVESFAVTRPSTALYGGSQGAGRYADGLVATAAPTSDPAYFELAIARDAAPGVVDGELRVGSRSVPVAVTIVPVTLPALPLAVWAYGDPRELVWARTDERACVERFAQHGVLLSPDVHLEQWEARRASFAGVHDVPVWISDDPARAGDEVKQWIERFAGTGQVPFAIPIDEPRSPERRRQVRALAEVVRAAGGGPGRFRFAVTDEPRPEYGDLIDLYISPRAAHLTGDQVARWTYNGAPPAAGAMVLDAASPGMRTWGWIAWRWQIAVWYVWDALYWHDRHNRKHLAMPLRALDVMRDPVSFDDGEDHGNFDGVLALPGCRPTLRLAALRRGLQDRALLELAAACDRPATEKIAAELVPRALGDATETAAWPGDEVTWEAARRRLLTLAACHRTAPAR